MVAVTPRRRHSVSASPAPHNKLTTFDPSLNLALASNCSELPAAGDAWEGEIEMNGTAASVTVKVVEAAKQKSETPRVVDPPVRTEASPTDEIVAREVVDDVHATVPVIVFTEPWL